MAYIKPDPAAGTTKGEEQKPAAEATEAAKTETAAGSPTGEQPKPAAETKEGGKPTADVKYLGEGKEYHQNKPALSKVLQKGTPERGCGPVQALPGIYKVGAPRGVPRPS